LNHISSAEAHTPGQWQHGSKQPQVPQELGTQQVLQQSQQLLQQELQQLLQQELQQLLQQELQPWWQPQPAPSAAGVGFLSS
jgi:hypothetical protein